MTSAALKLRVTGKADTDNRSLMAEWYGAANWPIEASDFGLDSSGTALAGADLTAVAVGAVTSFDLTGLASVSTTGSTGLRLHVSGGQPSGDNYLQLASFENSLPNHSWSSTIRRQRQRRPRTLSCRWCRGRRRWVEP